jgi:hypothetical protein
VLIGCARGLPGRGCLPLCQLPKNKWSLVLKTCGLCEDQLLATQPENSPFVTGCGLSSRGHAQSITAEETDGEEWCLKLSPSVTKLDIASASPSSLAICIAVLKWMPRLRILTLDLALCTTSDAANSILRNCPSGLKIHHRPQLGAAKQPPVFPPYLTLFAGRLVSFAGCVSAYEAAVLAKCRQLQEVDLWFNWQQYDFKTSGAVQHDIVDRLCNAKIPVTSINVWGINDIELVTPFKKTLQRLTITCGNSVDVSFLKPSRTRGGGLQQLHLCACDLDANSCALIAAARIPLVKFDDCIFRPTGSAPGSWDVKSFEFDLFVAERVLKSLVCKSVSARDKDRSIQCTPQYKKKLDSKLMGI